MANFLSTELTNEAAAIPSLAPVHKSTKLHFKYFTYTQSGAGTLADTVEFIKLPAGDVRVFRNLSLAACSAQGGTATLAIGLRAYTKYTDNSSVAESATFFASATSVVSAANVSFAPAAGTDPTVLIQAKDRVAIFGTNAGSAIPNNATISGYVVYANN